MLRLLTGHTLGGLDFFTPGGVSPPHPNTSTDPLFSEFVADVYVCAWPFLHDAPSKKIQNKPLATQSLLIVDCCFKPRRELVQCVPAELIQQLDICATAASQAHADTTKGWVYQRPTTNGIYEQNLRRRRTATLIYTRPPRRSTSQETLVSFPTSQNINVLQLAKKKNWYFYRAGARWTHPGVGSVDQARAGSYIACGRAHCSTLDNNSSHGRVDTTIKSRSFFSEVTLFRRSIYPTPKTNF